MEDLKKIQEFFSKPLEEMMSLDDEAKAYYLAKVKSGEIDTLPENPKAAFLAQMTKDQMDHDKETLRRERGLEEVTKSQMLKKAKKGSYPATLVAIENGKVVAQEKVNTPQEAPAAHSVMAKKYPNAKIRLEDNTGKILEEGNQLDIEDFAKIVQAVERTGHPVTVLLVPKFNEIEIITGMNAPDDMLRDLSNAVDALGYGRNDIFIAGDSSNLSRREYSDIRRVNGGAKDYFEESVNEYNTGLDYHPSKEKYTKKSRNSSLKKVKDMIKRAVKEGDITVDDKTEFKVDLKHLLDKHVVKEVIKELKKGDVIKFKNGREIYILGPKGDGYDYKDGREKGHHPKGWFDMMISSGKATIIASEQKMGEALSDYEEEEVNYDELYSDYKYKVDEAKPKKSHGEKISKEVFAKLKGKTVNYKGTDYKVVDSDEAVLTLKDEDGKSKTLNLKQFNDSGLIDEIIETVLLGKQLNEELCAKGKAYIKKRKAAGEKSSAYLSGRAVKVCKGQMKG